MVAGPFKWVRPDVYPLIAAVSVGCSMGVYIMTRKMFFDPSVDLNRERRQYQVKPESSGYEDKARSYQHSAIFEQVSKLRHPHFFTAGEVAAEK